MENDQLKLFYDLKNLVRNEVECQVVGVSDEGTSSLTEGIEQQQFRSVRMVVRELSDEITDGGTPISKTFFSRTHPGAFEKVTAWADLDEEELKRKTVKGFLIVVPTKKPFVQYRRDRDENSPTFGELVPLKNSQTGKVATASQMTFFVLKNESITSELRRRGTQLEKRGSNGWITTVSSHEPESLDDLV